MLGHIYQIKGDLRSIQCRLYDGVRITDEGEDSPAMRKDKGTACKYGECDLLVETPGSTSRSTAPGVARTAAEIASMT